METFSSEIGKKMRSAVKAKLIELGTEGTSGYVDDELPDYVMIMVANKRSKQQMASDLTLFLGEKTELFVTWLHEVLQKLQEVTIPTATAKKRKAGQKDEVSIKKDKKTTKKDKKPLKKQAEHPIIEKVTPIESTPIIPVTLTGTITDAIAEELLEKANHNMNAVADAASQIKKGKSKKSAETNAKDDNEFDIPTITEISSTTGSNNNVTKYNREKDLAELAEIQKRIYAAKKHLKELGELKDPESEDEDFLRLRHEGSSDLSDTNIVDNESKQEKPKSNDKKEKSPIVFVQDKQNIVKDKSITPPSRNRARSPQPIPSATIAAPTVKTPRTSSIERRSFNVEKTNEKERRTESIPQRERDREKREASPHNKRPVYERLGIKTQNNDSRTSRREKELYVPAHRRQDNRSDREYKTERWRSREREREREKDRDRDEWRVRGEKSRERSESRHNSKIEKQEPKKSVDIVEENIETTKETSLRQRIGSRVIIAPPSAKLESSDDEVNDKPVNSIIKIKPRPAVSPSKQACKTLLMRAVAEAQRSTILKKPKTEPVDIIKNNPVKSRLGKTLNTEPHEELFTKNLRERRLKRNVSNLGASTLFRRQAQNFIVKVDGDLQSKRRRKSSPSSAQSEVVIEDEYNLTYKHDEADPMVNFKVKQLNEKNNMPEDADQLEDFQLDDDTEEYDEIAMQKTQFVVTLNVNDEKSTKKYTRRNIGINSSPPHAQVSSSSSSLIRNNRDEPSSTTTQSLSRSRPKDSTSRRSDIRSRLSDRRVTPSSPSRAARLKERESYNSSSSSSNTPPRPSRSVNRKSKDVKKIIIKNDTDDEEIPNPLKQTSEKERIKNGKPIKEKLIEKRSRSTSLPKAIKTEEDKTLIDEPTLPVKNKHTPIKFDLDTNRTKNDADSSSDRKDLKRESKSKSRERSVERHNEERRRISIREINNKYDNIPALSSISLESNSMRVVKPKERCKYHPNCTKQFCDFYHPSAPCKAFPNCKYADNCIYSHPKCKYDTACTNPDCNFSHSGPRNLIQSTAPPLSSHVVPVQNYKTISSAAAGASSAMCKYYPSCTKAGCTFFHPKACRYGKNCVNQLECNFYHHELQSSSKFKWVASAT